MPEPDVTVGDVVASAASAFGELLRDLRHCLAHWPDAPDVAPATRGAIEQTLAIVARGDRLAADLLAYAGQAPLSPSTVELLPLLCALAHTLRTTLGTRFDVVVDVDRDCPPAHVDAAALEAALLNLAVNARDAMPEGGRMCFSAARLHRAGDAAALALSVSDSGRGMAAPIARQATLPFFTTKTGGLPAGLGLAAVDGFARQSGGRLDIRTQAGLGTTVTLTLPQAPLQR